MEMYPILSHAPVAGVLTILTGAVARAILARRKARLFGVLAATILLGLMVWSYHAPVNLVIWAILFVGGIVAWGAAVVMSSKSWLLIEPVAFPIWLIIVMQGV